MPAWVVNVLVILAGAGLGGVFGAVVDWWGDYDA
jgi:hypothetical protein